MGTVGAIFTTSSRLDTEQSAQLDPVLVAPMFPMDLAGLVEKREKRLAVNGGEFGKGFGMSSVLGHHAVRVEEKGEEVKN